VNRTELHKRETLSAIRIFEISAAKPARPGRVRSRKISASSVSPGRNRNAETGRPPGGKRPFVGRESSRVSQIIHAASRSRRDYLHFLTRVIHLSLPCRRGVCEITRCCSHIPREYFAPISPRAVSAPFRANFHETHTRSDTRT